MALETTLEEVPVRLQGPYSTEDADRGKGPKKGPTPNTGKPPLIGGFGGVGNPKP